MALDFVLPVLDHFHLTAGGMARRKPQRRRGERKKRNEEKHKDAEENNGKTVGYIKYTKKKEKENISHRPDGPRAARG